MYRIESPLALTRIGLHLDHIRSRVENLGEITDFGDGEVICISGQKDRTLFVVVEGIVDYGAGWLSAGAHFGELGFLIDQPRTSTVYAKGRAICWKIESGKMMNDPEASFYLVSALVRELPRRVQKFNATPNHVDNYSDTDHPAISSLSNALRGKNDSDTARSIWNFVRAMPYRFGPWWEKASDTLKAGSGMCTTKSNLQVTLMRAAGLEAGFTLIYGGSELIAPVMPVQLKTKVSGTIKHYMATVKLDGEWLVADSSFTDPVLRKFAERFPVLNSLFPCHFGSGHPFNPAAVAAGADLAPSSIYPDLKEAMNRRSNFDLDQFELLNIVNDRLQGTVHDEPSTLIRANRILPVNPELALHTALGAAAIVASELHHRIINSNEPV